MAISTEPASVLHRFVSLAKEPDWHSVARRCFAWPTARYAVMGGDAAAGTLAEIKLKQLEREGKKVDEKAKQELLASIKATYDKQSDPRYAAARLWVDAIIDPAHTRDALIWALEAAALNSEIREFKTGVLQT